MREESLRESEMPKGQGYKGHKGPTGHKRRYFKALAHYDIPKLLGSAAWREASQLPGNWKSGSLVRSAPLMPSLVSLRSLLSLRRRFKPFFYFSLPRKIKKSRRRPTLARASPALPSAMGPLTSVFGMGTGVTTPLWSPAKKPFE